MTGPWKRANQEEQKEMRRKEIREAALALRETCPFSEMTLADIARHASFTRSNLYKYYSSRDDLFLSLLRGEFLSWVAKAEEIFSAREYSLKEFSHIWIDLILRFPLLIELLSLSLVQMEKGADESSLVVWFHIYTDGMFRLNRVIRNLFPRTEKDDIDEFLILFLSQMTGTMPLLRMDDSQSEMRRKHGIDGGRDYYREILCQAVESLLSPWLHS
jgi:TetR/AcrR family transcriptional regulator